MRNHQDAVIATSDFHLCDRAPACRRHAGEAQWIADQAAALGHLNELCLPVICAGDVFDEPYKRQDRPSPGLLNVVLETLPSSFYCVAGQHDLPGHSLDMLSVTPIRTLELAGRATILRYDEEPSDVEGWIVVGYPWETGPHPGGLEAMAENVVSPIMVVTHRMVWKGVPPYPGAPEDGNAKAIAEEFRGARVVITGDNHEAFVYKPKDPSLPLVVNPGSLMRIRSNQTKLTGYYIVWLNGERQAQADWQTLPDSMELSAAEQDGDGLISERAQFRPFVEALNGQRRAGVSYEDNIRAVLDSVKPPRPVRVRVLDSLKGDEQ